MNTVLQLGNWSVTGPELVALLQQYQMLPQLLREMIIEQAIAPLTAPPEECDRLKTKFREERYLTTPERFEQWLQQQHLTIEQWNQQIVRAVKFNHFKEQTWGSQLPSYFLQCKDRFDTVVYSLLRTEDIGIAQELYFRILEGEANFTELAPIYSQGPEAKTKGLIGPVSVKNLHPDLIKLFKNSYPGQLFTPVAIDHWFVIVRLEEYHSAELTESIRHQLLEDCFNHWLQQQLQSMPVQIPHGEPQK